jgi:hypothetical protein
MRIRTCDSRCHDATGTQCNCWCKGQFHGAGGYQPEALSKVSNPEAFLKKHGFKPGKTFYKEQIKLPI